MSGSLSKAYSLAGIRVGWIASPSKDVIEACAQARDYTTISVSQLDDHVAAYAISSACRPSLLRRNTALARTNLDLLTRFVAGYSHCCSWVKPVAGTTAFIRFDRQGSPADDAELSRQLHEKFGVLTCPGSTCFGGEHDFRGYVRIGYCCDTEVLKAGLKAFREFMDHDFNDLDLQVGLRQAAKARATENST